MSTNTRKSLMGIWEFFSRSFILLGLPLLAWGLADTKGFFSSPVRTGFAVVVGVQASLYGLIIAFTPVQLSYEHRFDLARWHAYIFESIFVVSAFGDRREILTWGENIPVRWLGLGIYLIGAILSVWANFSWANHLRLEGEQAIQNPVLLEAGPFKYIRYPTLLCLSIYSLGCALIFRSWFGLALMIALLAGVAHRSNSLDRVYADQFPALWHSRYSKSKRFIPLIY